MKNTSRFALLSAAAFSLGLALSPVAYAQGMKDDGMKKPAAGTMKKDAMDKSGAMSDPKKDTMAKPDTMGKDSMSKPDTMSKDNMKRSRGRDPAPAAAGLFPETGSYLPSYVGTSRPYGCCKKPV